MTAQRNIYKVDRMDLGIVPEFRPLWTTAIPDPAPKGGKKKKKGKGKKKK
jgi:hypothetical protein